MTMSYLRRFSRNIMQVDGRSRGFHPNWYLLSIALVVILILVTVTVLMLTLIRVFWTDVRIYSPRGDTVGCPGISSEEDCLSKGCVYEAAVIGPSCSMKKNQFGFRVENVTDEKDGPSILLKSLSNETPYGPSFERVVFKLTYLTENILRFQFKDADRKRYEVPIQEEFPLLKENKPLGNTDNLTYEVRHTNESEVFQFEVKRKDEETYLWNTSIGALLLSDQFLQIGSYLPSRNVYGIGEQVHDTLRHRMDFVSWPLFAGDQPPVAPTDGKNLYGVHPFYTCLETSGKSHGVFLLNSNAMEVTFMPAPAVTFRTTGGILDFFIFVGDNPEHVVQLYTSLIGRPMIPPYWALGFQLSKYGYGNITELQTVLNRTKAAKIPHAVQYLDIDHLDRGMDFTYDNETFAGLPDLINRTQVENNLKWIIIQEPVIAADGNNEPYTDGLKNSVFVKRSRSWPDIMFPKGKYTREKNVTLGKVWSPSYVAFLDFFKNETKKWWKERLVEHRKTIQYDGIWIDMNEPANFGTNEDEPEYCSTENIKDCWALRCPEGDPLETPPYNPLEPSGTDRLSHKTICMSSVHGDSGEENIHYNVHSLYGWSQSQPTLEAAQEATGTRSIVISRSTYPSSGRYAGHWLGDNRSTYKDMQKSIIGMLEFNMFGIPYVGADVCGFYGQATGDLCKRWMQLGAFYPFFRNHNFIHSKPQDPAVFDKEVVEVSRRAIERRIGLNMYLYTLFYRANVEGSTVVRPMFHEFPTDEATWDLATQFMWGKSIMISAIVEKNRKSINVYFPKDEWWLFKEIQSIQKNFTNQFIIEVEDSDYAPVYIRGGTILPYAKYDWENYTETSDTRILTLYVFPKDGEASGELFMDDGISKDTVENEAYAVYDFSYKNCTLEISAEEHKAFNGTHPFLERVVIFKATDIANVTGGFKTRRIKKFQCAVVHVNEKLKNVQTIGWVDSKGKCPDSK